MTITGASEIIPGKFRDKGGAVWNIVHPDFGADPTGVAAAQTAINAAITAAAVTGGTVFVPPGSYKITGQITLASNVRLVGAGREQSLFVGAFAGGIGVYASAKTNMAVGGIGFSGLFAMGVVYDTCTKVAVRRCSFTGCTSSTHATQYAFGCGSWVSDDVTIEDNYFSGNGYIGAGLSADIQINGNGANTGSQRIRITGNRCLSTSTQYGVVAYDIQHSAITDNVCTGAKTGAGNNNGYGIGIYHTTVNSGVMLDNRIENNMVYAVGGTGIYVQTASRTAVVGNVIYDAGAVQDDTTLVVGGIGFSNCYDCSATGNVIINCGKAGIGVGGISRGMLQASGEPGGCDGYTITGNTIDTIAGPGIFIRGPLRRSTIANNPITGCTTGIGTRPTAAGRTVSDGVTTNASPTVTSATANFTADDIGLPISGTGIPANTTITAVASTTSVTMSANATATATGVAVTAGGISGCTITGNPIEVPSLRGIDLYGIARSTVSFNPIARAGKDGIALTSGSDNSVIGNILSDGSTVTTNTYTGIILTQQPGTSLHENRITNTGATGFKFAVASDSLTTNLTIADNKFSGMLTSVFSVVLTSTTVIRNNAGYNPVGIAAITVTASPFTYTAGASPEAVSVMGGTVSLVTKNGGQIASASPAYLTLSPNQSIVVTYTVAPTMAKDVQ